MREQLHVGVRALFSPGEAFTTKFVIFVSKTESRQTMGQITLTTSNPEKEQALLEFLKTLDYVKVELVGSDLETRQKAAKRGIEFLKTLSERPSRQSDVNKAIKEYRQSKGYK